MSRNRRLKKRIVILCEGDTEESAIKYFVWRQWQKDGFGEIGLSTVNLKAQFEKISRYAQNNAKKDEVLAVFTLIDLYGMDRVRHRKDDGLSHKVVRVQKWLRKGLSAKTRQKFRPHLSVHEVEAWLLADGLCLAKRLNDQTIQPDPYAETRNFENPPSRRLQTLFQKTRSKSYLKIQDNTVLFQDADFATVYASCPYFKAFYDELKAVAEANL
jgi:hypothetical protein